MIHAVKGLGKVYQNKSIGQRSILRLYRKAANSTLYIQQFRNPVDKIEMSI